MIKVSVIIPVYNAENGLKRCIDSLLNQTLTDIEFIFVNDGSKDKSQSIIESFQKNDDRIKIYNQENQGVSVARNNGIQYAKGAYLGFVDADDYIDATYFEKLYNHAITNDVAIAITTYISQIDNLFINKKSDFPENKIYKSDFIANEIIPTLISESGLNIVWNKIYKTSFIKENAIIFPKGVALGEDNIFNLQAFNIAKSVFFIDFPGYHYIETSGSATKNIAKNDYFARALQVYNFDYNLLLNKEVKDLKKLKSIRFFNNTLIYIDIYLKNANGFSTFEKYKYVKNMINHALIQSILVEFETDILQNKSNHQKKVINCIKNKKMGMLLLLNQYSQFRNK